MTGWSVEVGSEITTRLMSRFPSKVTRYMDRNRIKSKGCSSGSSERPMRKNSETLVRFCVRFCGCMYLGHLWKRNDIGRKKTSKWHAVLFPYFGFKQFISKIIYPSSFSNISQCDKYYLLRIKIHWFLCYSHLSMNSYFIKLHWKVKGIRTLEVIYPWSRLNTAYFFRDDVE